MSNPNLNRGKKVAAHSATLAHASEAKQTGTSWAGDPGELTKTADRLARVVASMRDLRPILIVEHNDAHPASDG